MDGKELKRLRLDKGLTQGELSKETGIPQGTISRFEASGEIIKKVETLNSLHKFFKNEEITPHLNTHFEPIKPTGIVTSMNSNRRKATALIPYYNADFMAGFAEEYYDDAVIYPEYYMDVPEFSGCTAFRAYSDSMETRIKSGNILFGTKLEDWQSHLEYGQIYGITCTDGRRYLKYIRKAHDHRQFFLLKSENVNYDDFELPKIKIKNIWLIEGWLDKRT